MVAGVGSALGVLDGVVISVGDEVSDGVLVALATGVGVVVGDTFEAL